MKKLRKYGVEKFLKHKKFHSIIILEDFTFD